MVSEAVLNAAPENELIRNTMKKADLLLNSYKNPVCSVSGGSDSDVMLDLLERVRGNRKVTYVFFDTGIEYRATLRHLDDLEAKYGIEIVRRKAKKPVPVGCKEYGVPFFSKEISQKISYLQAHGFQWENEPFEVLNERYTGCKAGLKWWTGENGERSKFSIYRNAGMKEFMLSTPQNLLFRTNAATGRRKTALRNFSKNVMQQSALSANDGQRVGLERWRIHLALNRCTIPALRGICPSTFGVTRTKRSIKLITAYATRIATRCTV